MMLRHSSIELGEHISVGLLGATLDQVLAEVFGWVVR
jgi:hypothetical protein